tara:strand:- start:3975 stop:5084 length:1110 start_codon:yes stop_codon:yes gene_type:complete
MPISAVKPQHYASLLSQKAADVCSLLAPFAPPSPEVYASPPTGFRLRAEFRMWHEGDSVNYVMFRRDAPKKPVVITQFPIADERIQALMPVLREKLNASETLRRKLFQLEFLTTLSGDTVVTLAYHRKLDAAWESAATVLATELASTVPAVSIIGRSRKQKIVIGRDFVNERLSVLGQEFRYRQYEQAFSQPNGRININMLEWACKQSRSLPGDLLELYCGNGNFTLPLSRHFNNVIATELSKTSIRAARENLLENGIDNVQLLRMSAEEVTAAMNAQRVFRRLSELPKPLEQYDLETVFVDPPRAGLDAYTLEMVSRFQTIIYISCNPVSLVENLRALHSTHRIAQFALFDQFPYTDHMECGVIVSRR